MFRSKAKIQREKQGQIKTVCHTVSSKKKGTNNRGKENTNELKTECPVCGSKINKYQVKRHEESIKHQTKLKGKEQPKVVRNGDDETGMLGI